MEARLQGLNKPVTEAAAVAASAVLHLYVYSGFLRETYQEWVDISTCKWHSITIWMTFWWKRRFDTFCIFQWYYIIIIAMLCFKGKYTMLNVSDCTIGFINHSVQLMLLLEWSRFFIWWTHYGWVMYTSALPTNNWRHQMIGFINGQLLE